MSRAYERMIGPQLMESDYEELPPAKDGRRPVLRASDATNLASIEDTGRHTLSHTRLSVWLACSRKFELSYVKRLETVERPRYFTLGTAYQKAIEFGDPEVGVRFLNGFEPCEPCAGIGLLNALTGKPERLVPGGDIPIESDVCMTCAGRGYTGEQTNFWTEAAERQHLINMAIVRGASKLYLKTWPQPIGETREFEYKIRLRSPWTGAYSQTYDLLGYADGVIDPLVGMRMPVGEQGFGEGFDFRPGPEASFEALGVRPGDVQGMLDAARIWEAGGNPPGAPLEIVENKLVGRIEKSSVLALPLNRQLALERYGIWRATGRPVTRVWYRWMKKPSIEQRGGRKKDKSDAETVEQYCERVEADYEARPDFYAVQEDPSFLTTKDLLRVEADLWEDAEDIRSYMRPGSDGRRRVFPRDTSRCTDYGGCDYLPICTGAPDAVALYNVRPKRAAKNESAPEAGQE